MTLYPRLWPSLPLLLAFEILYFEMETFLHEFNERYQWSTDIPELSSCTVFCKNIETY